MTDVTITSPPSIEGATQNRNVAVQFTNTDKYQSLVTSVVLSVDATQNGSFRALSSNSGRLSGLIDSGESKSETLTEFIGVQPPYDLRIAVTFREAGDARNEKTTVQDTVSVGGQYLTPEEPTVGAEEELDSTATRSQIRGGDATQVTPRIGPVEPITMSASYQLPWSRDTNQTACGDTLQQQNGDLDWRIVFEGILTLEQVDKLRSIRTNSGEVETRSAVFGIKVVTFDQLQLDRTDKQKSIEANGTVQPAYQFQLQTKELETDDEGELFG